MFAVVYIGWAFKFSGAKAKSFKIATYLITMMATEFGLVWISETMAPGGHPSLGALIFIFSSMLNLLLIPAVLILLAIGSLGKQSKFFVISGYIICLAFALYSYAMVPFKII